MLLINETFDIYWTFIYIWKYFFIILIFINLIKF